MKNLFNDLSSSEKNRILEMHKGATKRNYLSEQIEIKNNRVDTTLAKIMDEHGSFESFLDSLPELIEHLVITNPEGLESIDIPENIGEIRNLQAFLFQGFVKSLPESIGDLTRISFISLINNPELLSLPESIGNMRNLAFINLKDSENVELPDSIKDKVKEFSDGDPTNFYYIKN
jgi:hypothetical protein